MSDDYKPEQDDRGLWHVTIAGTRIAGPFLSNYSAWEWIDRQDSESGEQIDTHNRIRNAFSDR